MCCAIVGFQELSSIVSVADWPVERGSGHSVSYRVVRYRSVQQQESTPPSIIMQQTHGVQDPGRQALGVADALQQQEQQEQHHQQQQHHQQHHHQQQQQEQGLESEGHELAEPVAALATAAASALHSGAAAAFTEASDAPGAAAAIAAESAGGAPAAPAAPAPPDPLQTAHAVLLQHDHAQVTKRMHRGFPFQRSSHKACQRCKPYLPACAFCSTHWSAQHSALHFVLADTHAARKHQAHTWCLHGQVPPFAVHGM